MIRPALFLDRDGIVNADYAYVSRKDEFHFIEGIFELVKTANLFGYSVVIVTNQAGIGRGYYSEQDFLNLMDWVKNEFVKQNSRIDAVYYCPYHPIHGIGQFRKDSNFRKPRPGMLWQATKDLNLDLAHSVMVGDKRTDMEAALEAKVGTLFLLHPSGEKGQWRSIESLYEVIEHLRNVQNK